MQEGPSPEGREKAIADAGRRTAEMNAEREGRIGEAVEALLTAFQLAAPAPIEMPRPLLEEAVKKIADVGPKTRAVPAREGHYRWAETSNEQVRHDFQNPPPAPAVQSPSEPEPGTVVREGTVATNAMDDLKRAVERYGARSEEAESARQTYRRARGGGDLLQ